MSNPEQSQSHPEWEGAIVGFLEAVENGIIPESQITLAATHVCHDLIKNGLLGNFGELQQYLRQRGASVQLIAQPFKLEAMPRSDLVCKDPITNEPRGHCLLIAVGVSDLEARLSALKMSDEINETALARDTGLVFVQK